MRIYALEVPCRKSPSVLFTPGQCDMLQLSIIPKSAAQSDLLSFTKQTLLSEKRGKKEKKKNNKKGKEMKGKGKDKEDKNEKKKKRKRKKKKQKKGRKIF